MLSRWLQRISAVLIPAMSKSIMAAASTKPMAPVTHGGPLSTRLIWVDCEMTGLDPEINRICEIALVITEGDLTPVAQFDPIIIKQTPESMQNMSKWCKKTFKKNGLLTRIAESNIDTQNAEEQVLKFLQEHTEPFTCALAGNSVYMDRLFIAREMPLVAAHFHYRTVDVSTIKELVRRWYPAKFAAIPEKKMCHRSIDDILESIEELKHYQKEIFIPLPEASSADSKPTA
uniref:Probable oligoribonuclease n=1 Tax=Panagrellus redivivus TaxID=6233 RepID=A0A7E5A1J8_PANRE